MDHLSLKPGDVLGFSGHGWVTDFINVMTGGLPRWGLGHIGIVARYKDDLVLFESTTLNDDRSHCIIAGKGVHGVQAHYLEDAFSRPGKIWLYPLSYHLYADEGLRLSRFLVNQAGLRYDLIGAGRSGGLIPRLLTYVFRREDLEELFCSELVAAAFSNIGVLPTANASTYSPNGFVRRAIRKGLLKPRVRIK